MFLEIKDKFNLKSTNHRRVANHFTAMTALSRQSPGLQSFIMFSNI